MGNNVNKHTSFRLVKKQYIEEIKSYLLEYEHIKSKACIIHIKNEDPENLFVISFPTYADSSNGVFHILEHTVLCGSQKYPVKDPFFSMLRRSLATFMNAMTGADFTCYPASSQIEKDFYQLMQIYLDAVFHPLLKKMSFLQEGWRLEFTEPDNPDSELTYKGVVYNEMKGALSSTDERLHYHLMKELVPDLPYSYETGGLPSEIPTLTHKQLLSAHKKFYHPSHGIFFFYGNLATEKHLDFLEENCLKNFSKSPPLETLPKQKRFSKPKQITTYYPAAEKDQKTIVSMAALTCEIQNQKEALALALLEHILFANDGSLVCKPLLESGLCLEVDSILNFEMSEVPWQITLKGIDKTNQQKALHLLEHQLKKIAAEKIPENLIDAALHQLEFVRTEIARHMGPYGLSLFFSAVLAKHHGIPLEKGLQVQALFQLLSEDLKDESFLPSLIEKYLLNNLHKVIVSMLPDNYLHDKEKKQETEILKQKKELLTVLEKKQIVENSQKLKTFQNKQENSLDCLPIFPISEIPKPVKNFSLSYEKHPNLHLYSYETFTNQILYADLIFDLPNFSEKELHFLTLFAYLLPQIGCQKRSYSDNLNYINQNLGDFSVSLFLNSHCKNPDLMTPTFNLRSKALKRKTSFLFSFLQEMAQTADFSDQNRIKELILAKSNALKNHLSSNALSYAMREANSNINLYHYLNNYLSGLPYYRFMQNLSQNLADQLDQVIIQLKTIQDKIFTQKEPSLVLTMQPENSAEKRTENARKILNQELSKIRLLKTKEKQHWKNPKQNLNLTSSAKSIPAAVAFNAYAIQAPAYTDPSAPYLTLAGFLMENLYLHSEIREKGGAYGSGANYHHGAFYFYTYRDPNIQNSFNAFKMAIQKISDGHFTQHNLEEAIRGAIRDIEEPFSPGAKGIHSFYLEKAGKTKELRQNFKNALLETDKKKICTAVQKYLLKQEGAFSVFAGQKLLEENLPKDIPIETI